MKLIGAVILGKQPDSLLTEIFSLPPLLLPPTTRYSPFCYQNIVTVVVALQITL